MKNRLFLICLLFIWVACDRVDPYSQEFLEELSNPFEIHHPDGTLYGSTSSSILFVKSEVFSNSSQSMDITWNLLSSEIPRDWELNVCDPVNCWGPEITTKTFTLIPRGDGLLDAGFRPGGVPGEGRALIEVWAVQDSAETYQVIEFNAVAERPEYLLKY
ncbi:MAG: hypothetical protein AAF487_05860 [Bacteroidota bacterium]